MRRDTLSLFGAFFLCSVSVHALNLASIETAIRRNVRDTATDTSLQRYSDSVLDDFINEYQREVVNLTYPLYGTTTYTLSAGTTYYNLPTDYLAVKSVYYFKGSTVYELKANSEQSYRKNNPNYEAQRGPPSDYFVRNTVKTSTETQIAFIPVQTTSTGTVNVEYYYSAPDLSSDTDIPFDGQGDMAPFHDILVYGVSTKIKTIEAMTSEAQVYQQLYSDKLNIMMNRFRSNPNYSPSIIAGPSK